MRGSLWVLPTLSVLVALAAGAALSPVSTGSRSPLAFQGTADDSRTLLFGIRRGLFGAVTARPLAQTRVPGADPGHPRHLRLRRVIDPLRQERRRSPAHDAVEMFVTARSYRVGLRDLHAA